MAKRKGGGAQGGEQNRTRNLKGVMYAREVNGTLVVSAWPKKRGTPKSPITAGQNANWRALMQSIKTVDPASQAGARLLAEDTAYTYRDILIMCATGTYIEIEGLDVMTIQQMLDTIADQVGTILVRTATGWQGLTPGADGTRLRAFGPDLVPAWSNDPIATAFNLGQVIVDDATIVVDVNGIISATPEAVPIATVGSPGRATVDNVTLAIDGAGFISTTFGPSPIATTSNPGLVQPDGATITIDGAGVISATGGSGSGAWTKISQQVAANSATLDFTGMDTATKTYKLIGRGVRPATNAATGGFRVGTGSTPTWQNTNKYDYAKLLMGTGGFAGNSSAQNQSTAILNTGTSNATGGGKGVSFELTVTGNKWWGTTWQRSDDGKDYVMTVGGVWTDGNSFTAMRFLQSSGNIADGSITLYELTL